MFGNNPLLSAKIETLIDQYEDIVADSPDLYDGDEGDWGYWNACVDFLEALKNL